MSDHQPGGSNLGNGEGGPMDQAIALLKEGRLDESKAVCEQVLDGNGDNVAAIYAMGWIALSQQDQETALARFRQVIELNPEHARAHNNLGTILMKAGDGEAAARHFERAVALEPSLIEAHANLGAALLIQAKYGAAREVLQKAVDLAPDDPAALSNLATAKMWQGEVDEAIADFQRVVSLGSDLAEAHNNLAHALRQMGRMTDAIASCQEALRIDPEYAAAHSNLGSVFAAQGRLDEAVASCQEALRIDSDFADAHRNLGQALQKLGRFDEAISHFESSGGSIARARVLECLYAAGRTAAYSEYLSELCARDPVNIRAAAISAFAAHQWGAENPYPFCKDPLDFIYTTNLKSALAPFDGFFARIIKEIENAPALWEPTKNAVIGGFHTLGNLFDMETPEISLLRNVIGERVEDYRSRYADRDNGLIHQWPGELKLTGWHVRLIKSGYMEPHIHSGGWLSGVIYLKMPETIEGDEGTITFSLHGYDYPIRNNDIPTVQHVPKEGDLVLFPSSLFHYTTPFQSDEERHTLSFDMCP